MSKVIVLTGASDGIGAAAAQILADSGHQLILVGRSEEKTKRVADQVKADRYFLADYEKLQNVHRLADDIRECCTRIDILANNAGGLFSGPVETSDGFERTLQVNHLAPFLLTHKLMDILLDSKASVVNTSSVAAKIFGDININDLNNWNKFNSNKAYGDAKLANILFTKGLHDRYHSRGLSSVAFHPGMIATNFASDSGGYMKFVYHSALKIFLKSTKKGGETLSYFINGGSGIEWKSGEFYNPTRKIGKTNPQADDVSLVKEHWELSTKMLGLDVE